MLWQVEGENDSLKSESWGLCMSLLPPWSFKELSALSFVCLAGVCWEGVEEGNTFLHIARGSLFQVSLLLHFLHKDLGEI